MSKPNIEAKKERHKKLYDGQFHSPIGKAWFHFKRFLKALLRFIKPSRKRLSHFMHPLDHMPAPRRLYTTLSLWSIGFLVLTSVNITSARYEGGLGVGAEYEYLALDITENTLVTDEEGYLIKDMPLEGEAVYDLNRVEMITHEVQSGDTLSVIAYRYGLEVASIRYANSAIGNSDYLKVGQELNIPPDDGVYITVEESFLEEIEKYKGDADKTKEFNAISDEGDIDVGEEIFIVDGRPEVIQVVYSAPSTDYSAPATSGQPAVTQYNIPASSEGWIRPTAGRITQGYRGGHYAYDIGDRSKPPILAAASGTIIKAEYGWGGGYGNHIIIDHGNGYQTLYAHNEALYVGVGDQVSQGQVVAKMGNTGRVYGATGIHLHFEISFNGVKQSPSIMGVW